jgi:hypothetical protein
MSLTKVSYSMIQGAVANILDYGAVADYDENTPGSGTDNSAAIQAAINAVNAQSSNGAVYIPAGAYKLLTALSVPYGVSIFGDGGTASVLHAESCNGLNFTSFGYSIGSMFYEDFGLTAATGTNFAAVQSINVPALVTQDGLNFNRMRFYGWNQCFILASTWNTNISYCRAENINNFVSLAQSNGQAVIVKLTNNMAVYAAGGRGSGNQYAIDILGTTSFTEAVHLLQNGFYGFQRCINVGQATYVNIVNNDLSASVIAISFVTSAGGYNIVNNYIEVSGTGTGIFGAAQGSETPETRTNILSNYFVGTATAAIGIQLNTAVATYQWNATIRDNTFIGFATNDILLYSPGKSLVDNNRCMSTGPTNSISIGGVLGSPVIVTNNYCRKALYVDVAADYTSGKLILQNNVENDTFQATKQSAAPTTGTWRVTDVVMNSAPATGQPAGWVCTVAGTPGTWKPMANLA